MNQAVKFYQTGTFTVGNRLLAPEQRTVQASIERNNSLNSGHRACQGRAREERIRGSERVAFNVQRPVGAARQCLPKNLLHAGRAGGTGDHLAAVAFAEPQCLFQRIGVGLVHLVADVLLANPGFVVAEPRLPFAGRDLLDADGNFHGVGLSVLGVRPSALGVGSAGRRELTPA